MTTYLKEKVVFNVPVTAAQYAPEELVFGAISSPALGNPASAASAIIEAIDRLSILFENVATAVNATLEVWLLKVGGNPATAGDWFNPVFSVQTMDTPRFIGDWALLAGVPFPFVWAGAKLRCKSAGTAGTVTVSGIARVV